MIWRTNRTEVLKNKYLDENSVLAILLNLLNGLFD
jgi:hypothetical protein